MGVNGGLNLLMEMIMLQILFNCLVCDGIPQEFHRKGADLAKREIQYIYGSEDYKACITIVTYSFNV